MMRVPVGPPATPVAITGIPSVFSARATFTPLPPAMAVCSTARWRRPRRKFGTASVLSIAALSVTVMIMKSPLLPDRPHTKRNQQRHDEQRQQGYSHQPAAEARRRLADEARLRDRLGGDERHGAHHLPAHEHLQRTDPRAAVERSLDLVRCHHATPQPPPPAHAQ